MAEPSDIIIFDRAQIARARNRAAPHLKEHGFLIDWAGKQLLDRLVDIKRDFPIALQIGLRNNDDFANTLRNRKGTDHLFQMDFAQDLLVPGAIHGNEEFLPFAPSSLDLIISTMSFHSVNDLPGTLTQIKQAMKPDGLLIAAMLGGETLHELRTCLMEAELNLTGGVSPRIAPFADKQDMGALMQRAGFALPVIDSDIVTVTYEHIFALMKDLRFMGENNAIAARNKTIPPRALFMEAGKIYAEKFAEPAPSQSGRIRASFEVIFLIGWAPHDSQQQPMKPGSAKNRLADALQTRETKL